MNCSNGAEVGENTVLVFGDLMLDRYTRGVVERVSPEAPVPVLKVSELTSCPGGAANVAINLAALGARVSLVGCIGSDAPGDELVAILEAQGIDCSLIMRLPGSSTILKDRIVSGNQQIVRVDYSDDQPPFDCTAGTSFEVCLERVGDFDSVVVSDYAKGFCTPGICRSVIGVAKERNIPVIVDPKGADWSKYAGASLLTPNVKELSDYVGHKVANEDAEVEAASADIVDGLGLGGLLVTRSECGMSLFTCEGASHYPTVAREVFDVSGAGDTVVASIASRFGRLPLGEVVKEANLAAGVVVGKRGTATVTRAEVERASIEHTAVGSIRNKVVTRDELLDLVRRWRADGESVSFTNGCYDVFHSGHVHSISEAASLCDRLIVAVNSDESVRRLKGDGRPINSEENRALVVASLGCVAAVTIFDEGTPLDLIRGIEPDVLVKGGDYRPEDIVGGEFAKRVVVTGVVPGLSSTRIINQMNGANE